MKEETLFTWIDLPQGRQGKVLVGTDAVAVDAGASSWLELGPDDVEHIYRGR